MESEARKQPEIFLGRPQDNFQLCWWGQNMYFKPKHVFLTLTNPNGSRIVTREKFYLRNVKLQQKEMQSLNFSVVCAETYISNVYHGVGVEIQLSIYQRKI